MHSFLWFTALLMSLVAVPAHAGDPFLRHNTTVRVVKDVGPSVVNITTEQVVTTRSPFPTGGNPLFDSFFRDFFEPRLTETVQSLGSGVIIDAQGHILTNEHVIAHASRIRVSLADGTELDATLIGSDPNNDIAVLRATSDKPLPWLALGSSHDLMVGESVIAIGNPFGLSNSVTTGVISAINRSLRTQDRVFHGFIQTDASINPGNSGGPLVNAEGKLIAINTAVYSAGQGIGFAIPIDTAKRVVNELIAHGEITPVWLGLGFQNLNPELLTVMGLPRTTNGTLVNRVRENSPARAAGVRRGDVITHLDSRPVNAAHDLFEMLETSTAGQKLKISLLRDEKALTFTVELEELPHSQVTRIARERLGMELHSNPEGGYVVRSVIQNSGAARIGIQGGDIVLAISGQALADHDALRRSILALRGRSHAQIVVQRGAGRYHVTIPLV
jgi:serine protease Do